MDHVHRHCIGETGSADVGYSPFLPYHRLNGSSSPVLTATSLSYKCTKHQFIHLLTATFKDLHIENSKNYKR